MAYGSWMVPGYTEIRELGIGGSGRVMLASHDETGTMVAIKYLADSLTHDPSFVGDFRAEAEILNELDSPYVTRLYEYLESEGHAAIVMELVDGVSMRSVIRETGAVEPEAALTVLKGSLRGLVAAHGRKVVHRDYKPANVLVDTQGNSKLADFGLAVRAGKQGILAGTPSYMAPEQWDGSKATLQTDIYAATATFFECLTGRPPYVVVGDRGLLREAHEHAPIPVESTPPPVHGLLRHGLAKNPADRPRDAAAFLRELESAASSAYGPAWEAEGRRKLARRVLALALLLPRPAPPAPAVSSSAFAWTRFGRASAAVAALLIVVAGIVLANVALAEPGSPGTIVHEASATLPPTVLGPVITTSPSLAPPSPSPSPTVAAATATATPTPTKTKPPKKKPTPPPVDPPTSAAPSSPPPSSPPVPGFGTLVIAGAFFPQPCTPPKCLVEWQADARATGTGAAVLTVEVIPLSVTGAPTTATKTWVIPFTVSGSGPIDWPYDPNRSVLEQAACGDYSSIYVKATITVGGVVAKTASSRPIGCPVIIN